MECTFCGAKTKESTSTFVADLGDILIIVRNVPCLKCMQCGEEFYSNDVSNKLDEITTKAKESLTEIALIDYKKAA